MGQRNKNRKSTSVMSFTEEMVSILEKVDNRIAWAFYELNDNPYINNKLNIETLDISEKDYCFKATINNDERDLKISQFISTYLSNQFETSEITRFCNTYNKIKNRAVKSKIGKFITVKDFKFNPRDVKSTFISLVTETYPYGTEKEVMKYMPDDLSKDQFGNYYKIIGQSDTMFTSHLDTASRDKTKINLLEYDKQGETFIISDGTTILGADDKAGVTVMLYMISHNVPGIYYFFLGEERGGIGSGKVSEIFNSLDYLNGIKKVISFDRRNYYSVITEQGGAVCCSNEFAISLCDQLNKNGLRVNIDPTGVFTDSANFTDCVPECTNISVGYFNEHTTEEIQNITYLEDLCSACISVKWDKLTIKRKVGYNDVLFNKWKVFISNFKDCQFYNEISLKPYGDRIIIVIEFDQFSFDEAYNDMLTITDLFEKFGENPIINFENDMIKIELT